MRVQVLPAGAGVVRSSRSRLSEQIECNPTCRALFQQSEKVTLTAEANAAIGARFVEWRGGFGYCTPDGRCRNFPAFRISTIDAVFALPGRCEFRREGSAGADQLDGGPGGETLFGRGGADRLRGLEGDDCLNGGNGKDNLSGGPGTTPSTGAPERTHSTAAPGATSSTVGPVPGRDRRAGRGARHDLVRQRARQRARRPRRPCLGLRARPPGLEGLAK